MLAYGALAERLAGFGAFGDASERELSVAVTGDAGTSPRFDR
jgi:hypothetical protein